MHGSADGRWVTDGIGDEASPAPTFASHVERLVGSVGRSRRHPGFRKAQDIQQRSTDAHGKGYYWRRVPGHARGLSQHWHSDGRRMHRNSRLFRVEHDDMHRAFVPHRLEKHVYRVPTVYSIAYVTLLHFIHPYYT
uniref:Uncharacterized protein n=1 Tax=Schizaphis graminum TaxID=13262 RepID=A0A2S2P5D3_SCHGA